MIEDYVNIIEFPLTESKHIDELNKNMAKVHEEISVHCRQSVFTEAVKRDNLITPEYVESVTHVDVGIIGKSGTNFESKKDILVLLKVSVWIQFLPGRFDMPTEDFINPIPLRNYLEKILGQERFKRNIHSVTPMFGQKNQTEIFETTYKPKLSEDLKGKIKNSGLILNEMQSVMTESILKLFSQTNYKGNTTGMRVHDNKFGILELPVLQVSQRDLLLAGNINMNDPTLKRRALDALEDISKEVFYFIYERAKTDKDGKLIYDASGNVKKETVETHSTLFVVKNIKKDINTAEGVKQITGYYEIIPSAIFLDQVQDYFLYIPTNWRERVKEAVNSITGKRKTSPSVYTFIYFLMYQFEIKRRQKQNYVIKMSKEAICIKLGIEKMYKKDKKRALSILDEAYKIAQDMNYIKSIHNDGVNDLIELNEEPFYNPKKLTQ